MNYNELMEIKKKICSKYINHYVSKGYIEMPSLPLDYKKDITLDFTTCTICTAKDNIRQQKKGKDYVMIQPALRNTHIDVLGKMQEDDYFFSFFSMMGGFKYYSDELKYKKEFSEIIKSEFEFLKEYGNQIILTIPKQYMDFLEIDIPTLKYLKKEDCIIKYSTDDEKNLKWKYGMNGVVGYGTRWEISNNESIVNWGNTINVFVKDKPFGVDFGGGVESLIYANQKLKNSIYANDAMTDLTKEFCSNSSLHEKMIDCVVSSMCIIANKEKIILRDRYILDKYMNILNSLMILNNISEEYILIIVNDINSKNIDFLNKENMVEIFEHYLDKASHNHSVILNSQNIDKVLKLLELCYNHNNAQWGQNKKIIKSHYLKYFSNLSEAELFALQNLKSSIIKRKEKKYD